MSARLDDTRNCTLERYAFAKALPIDFLRRIGLETIMERDEGGNTLIKRLSASKHGAQIKIALLHPSRT